ncbi:MAG TPA: MerR family transcriptional regulator [Lapillicoccus sp.]|uniref:MerR family transcriptional regulator n=1 Tax=Lapillicoccus sp. TaxID=1909287 RepID=UPI002F95728F
MGDQRETHEVREQVRIGDVARRTGLTVRTLRYYEEIGLLQPSERLAGGHRVYGEDDIRRLHRVNLLRHVGVPLAQIPEALDAPLEQLADAVERHLAVLDGRLAAMGRLRERVRTVGESLRVAPDGPDERELVEVMEGLGEMDPSVTQRLTLLVYDDIEAVHDHLVTVFGFGPGRLSRDETGRVVHGELHVGDGLVWLHPSSEEHGLASPASLGVATHCMAVMVDDVDAHHARAVAAGAEVVGEPRDESYGYREYDARDLEGGLWSFMSPLEGAGDG